MITEYVRSFKWELAFFCCSAKMSNMEFTLVYQGPLPAASSGKSRADYKHLVRKQIHQQLAVFWKQHPLLSYALELGQGDNPYPPRTEIIGRNFKRGAYQFLPMLRRKRPLTCTLEILFLRRDAPGSIVS